MTRLLAGLFFVACLFGQENRAIEQAETAFRSGNFDEAAALAQQVLREDRGWVRAHIILGVIAAQRSQWNDAGRHFQAVIRLAPSNPYGYFYLGQAYLYQQQWDQAARYFESALERNYPDRTRIVIELALAQHKAGRPQKALSTLQKVQPPAEGSLAAQYLAVMGFVQGSLHQPDRAIDAVRRARELDPSNREYREFLISKLIEADRISLAVAEALEAQKRFPDHADVQFLFGLSSARLGNRELTRVALRNLLEVEPASPRSLLLQGIVQQQQGQNEKAREAFARAANSGVPDSHLLLGLILKESGDLAGAGRELQEAERLNPENGQTQFELGKLMVLRGKLSEALLHLQKAAQYMPRSSMVHYQLATLYRTLGDKEKAEQHLQTFERLKRESDQALAEAPFGERRK